MSVLELPKHLSASSITTYEQCPLRFRFSRIDRIPEPTTEAMILGTFVHEILEIMYSQIPNERYPTPDLFLASCGQISLKKKPARFALKILTIFVGGRGGV